jgi:iron-sulfur cluster repair protein YtfE (RIC family)
MSAAMDLSLEHRTALPDALRVLVEKHPRAGWEGHPHFSDLTRFWLDRHLMFRRMQAMLVEETEGYLDAGRDPRRYGAQLHRLAGMFLNELHGHHHIEDAHYFPLLTAQDARLVKGFELLDADHHAIDPLLHTLAERTNAVLGTLGAAKPDTALAGRLLAELRRFAGFLDRHLTDEEELVVPVILEYDPPGLR